MMGESGLSISAWQGSGSMCLEDAGCTAISWEMGAKGLIILRNITLT